MYGLKELDLKMIRTKHQIQKDYLENHYFNTSSGQVKTLLDVSFSANHSRRYYTELLNKINTINDIMITSDIEYMPIFITATLDGFFRDFLYANFSRYKEHKHKNLIPNNERFGYLRDKIENKERFTIRDLYNTLNFQFNRFQKSSKYMQISKDGFKAHYIKTYEPHKKDGVPHLHMMLYIPRKYKESIYQTYKKYFPTKQNLKPLHGCEDGQLNGFQWKIKSAPAYILKYLFKSFVDVQSNKDLDYLQAWYIKHRILRCITSKSLVPAWVYRKIVPIEPSWFHLTELKHTCVCEWSKDDDYIKFEEDNGKVLIYEKGIYKIYVKDKLFKEFGTKKESTVKVNQSINLKYKRKKTKPIIIIDNIRYLEDENGNLKLYKPITPIKYRTTETIMEDISNLTKKPNYDTNYYGLLNNELIYRDFKYFDNESYQIKCDEVLSLNEYKGF